jgi:hypothetical protein
MLTLKEFVCIVIIIGIWILIGYFISYAFGSVTKSMNPSDDELPDLEADSIEWKDKGKS